MTDTAIAGGELDLALPYERLRRASEMLALAQAEPWHDVLAELLATIADDMHDEDAVVKEFPTHIPSKRLLIVSRTYGREVVRYDWTEAWVLAAQLLGEVLA
jgi:hypothetical protein